MCHTIVERHLVAPDFCTGITGIRHIIHDDIDIAASPWELAINELKDKQSRFYTKLTRFRISD
jgi:hypothetical protein